MIHLDKIAKEGKELEQKLYWHSVHKDLQDSENHLEAVREQVRTCGTRVSSLVELLQISTQLERSLLAGTTSAISGILQDTLNKTHYL